MVNGIIKPVTPPIANPMSRFPEYAGSQKFWGVAKIPTVIVEVEDDNRVVAV
jgi:hypothetical protein